MVPRLPHPTSRTYRPPPALEALLLAAPLLGLAGCDDPAEPGPPPASLAELAFVDDTIPLTDILHRWTVEVRARDETGRPIPTESLGWSVGDSSVVKLLEPGLLEAQGSGRSWVAVSWEGRSDTAVVAVDARVKSVTASPAALELLPGADVGALVLVRDAEGDPLTPYFDPREVFHWSSTDPAVVETTERGGLRAVAPGTAGAVVAFGGLRDTVEVRVRGEPLRFATISASRWGACALATDGGLWCWGGGRTLPARASPRRTFHVVATTDDGGCALDAGGAAWCWGSDRFGQLGDGPGSPDLCSGAWPCSVEPVPVAGGHVFGTLRAWNEGACGLENGGEAWCWGSNPGWADSPAATPAPARMGGDVRWRAAAGGCGVRLEGGLRCWGYPFEGGPVDVEVGAALAGLWASSEAHLCALDEEGRAWCGGKTPDEVPGDLAFDAISPGHVGTSHGAWPLTHDCATTADRRAWCWGLNADGQLGTGERSQTPPSCPGGFPCSAAPVPAQPSFRWAEVSAGGGFTCGIADDGLLRCWGDATSGRLGVGGDWLYADGPWQPTRLEALGCEVVRSSSRADARCMHPVVVAGQG